MLKSIKFGICRMRFVRHRIGYSKGSSACKINHDGQDASTDVRIYRVLDLKRTKVMLKRRRSGPSGRSSGAIISSSSGPGIGRVSHPIDSFQALHSTHQANLLP